MQQFCVIAEDETMEINGGVALVGALIIWGCCAILGCATGAGIYVGYKQAEEANRE